MKGENVAFAEEGVEVHERHVQGFFKTWPEEGVAGDHAHAEGLGPHGGGGSDPAESEDPEGLAGETGDGFDGAFVPGLEFLTKRAFHGDKPSIEGEGEGHGVVGDLIDAVIRDVADGDATGGGCGEVDVVEADAAADDDAAASEALNRFGGEGDFVKNDEGVSIFDAAFEFFVVCGEEAFDLGEVLEFPLFDGSGRRECVGDANAVHASENKGMARKGRDLALQRAWEGAGFPGG